MSSELLAVTATAAACFATGLAAPRVIAALRQPEPIEDATSGGDEPASTGSLTPSFVDIASAPGLGPALAVLGILVGAIVGHGVGWRPALAAWCGLAMVALLLGYIDARTRLLPTQLIAPAYAVVGLLLVVAALSERSAERLWGALLGWAAMGGWYVLLWWFGPRGLGYGDVRLAGLLALCLGFLGWGELITGLYAGFLLGGAASLLLMLAGRASRRTPIPFGPFMLAGAFVGLLWGHQLASWYVSR